MAKTLSTQKSVTLSTDQIAKAAKGTVGKGLPPVHLWNPPYMGDLDIRIAQDGSWYHEGGKINRPEMVRLFSSILKLEDGNFFLVTPVEKVGITVEDAPFVAIDVSASGVGNQQVLTFETHVGDQVEADHDHPIRVSQNGPEPAPYVMIRSGLEARIDRKSFYRMVDLAVPHVVDGASWLGLWSKGTFFPLIQEDGTET